MLNTVGSCGYAKKLGKYKFSETLCASLEECDIYGWICVS